MTRPDFEAVIEQNSRSLSEVFKDWMKLPDVMSPESQSRWEVIHQEHRPTGIQAYLDNTWNRLCDLLDRDKLMDAITFVHQELSGINTQVSAEHLTLVESRLHRWRGMAQGKFVEQSDIFRPLDQEDSDRSRWYISAGVDGLRADVLSRVVTLETKDSAERFGCAGMPKLGYVIFRKVTAGLIDELLTRQVPRHADIRVMEEKLLKGVNIDFRGLRLYS